MPVNSLGRELPKRIGDYVVKPYTGAYEPQSFAGTVVTRRTPSQRVPETVSCCPA